MSIDLNLLRIFSAVAEQAQFASAARSLSMPTSNVSRAIKQLEQQ
ncbi:LysR family transcriptional regulator, partial [Proteus mirabilis]